MASIHLTPEYSTVRGEDGQTRHPRTEEQFNQALKEEYSGWGLVNNILKSFYFLAPVIFIGAVGSTLGGRLFQRFFPGKPNTQSWQMVRHLFLLSFDEALSAIFTGAFRCRDSNEKYWEASFNDAGEGVLTRIGLIGALSLFPGKSILMRTIGLPLAMTGAGWLAEATVEGDRRLSELSSEGAEYEWGYRALSTFLMVHGQSSGLLRGLPGILRRIGLKKVPSLHADDWRPTRGWMARLLPSASSTLLSPGGWNQHNRDVVARWLEDLDSHRPERLMVLSDLDHTAWAGDVADVVVEAAARETPDQKPVISWANALEILERPKRPGETPFDYYMRLYHENHLVGYNYAAQAFAGLTLRQAHEAFLRAAQTNKLPTPYPELLSLFNHLQSRGIEVGFVSASPIFMIIPMLEHAGYKVPMANVEGIDVYVTDPDKPAREISLSRLLHTQQFENWQQVLDHYGDKITITSHVGELTTAREGKGAVAQSILARHVDRVNQGPRRWNRPMRERDVIIAGVFGDNWAPFSDGLGGDLLSSGSDQGFFRAGPLMPGALLFNLYRAVNEGPRGNNYEPNRKSLERFRAFAEEVRRRNSRFPLLFISQVGIASGQNNVGSFDPVDIG